jgi:hypothetical protein
MWAGVGAEGDAAATVTVDPLSPAVRTGGPGQGLGLLTDLEG